MRKEHQASLQRKSGSSRDKFTSGANDVVNEESDSRRVGPMLGQMKSNLGGRKRRSSAIIARRRLGPG